MAKTNPQIKYQPTIRWALSIKKDRQRVSFDVEGGAVLVSAIGQEHTLMALDKNELNFMQNMGLTEILLGVALKAF